ncbi:MAG: TrmH family RNA methyltransferase [Candidatus Dojkabacteria bacterium]|nr:TrmH family RNA methyltransferase [Candidatus Dojkabacteria bacterium]MDQ7020438.1 TrmH family RNA methyltransferase [Candidatus Dojkabacteria bacterium]
MKEIIIMLDNVRSALNVGAIFRTCDGANVKKIYLSGITPYPPHQKVLKTALGAENYIDFEHVDKLNDSIDKYKEAGFEIISIEQTNNSKNFKGHEFGDKIVFIVGNEITGVSNEVIEKSDCSLELPMHGKKNSLNVATTLGISVYYIRLSE